MCNNSCEIERTLQLVGKTNPLSMYIYTHTQPRASLVPRSDATCNVLYGVMAQHDLIICATFYIYRFISLTDVYI